MDTSNLADLNLIRYSPSVSDEDWDRVKDFVVTTVVGARGRTAYSDADIAFVTTRLALWCKRRAAIPLVREQVFTRHNIDRFVQIGLPSYNEAARANFRSQLLRLAEAFLDTKAAPRKLVPMASARPSSPYTHAEVVSLRSWADTQSTPARRDNARVLLALGIGAGLSASEIGGLRVADIDADDVGVVVNVRTGRVREIPLLRLWEPALRHRKARLDGDRFAFREGHTVAYENLISNFVARSRSLGIRPQTQRMRATWLVRHLELGTPVVPLLQSAGLDSLEALTRYVRFVRPLDPTELREVLSGPAPESR
jgi:integrase